MDSLILAWIVCICTGTIIGNLINQGPTGFFVSLILGPLGVLIISFKERND